MVAVRLSCLVSMLMHEHHKWRLCMAMPDAFQLPVLHPVSFISAPMYEHQKRRL